MAGAGAELLADADLITPVPHSIARPLAEGLRNRTVCRDDRAARLMPQQLLTMRQAMDTALGHRAEDEVETAWRIVDPLLRDPNPVHVYAPGAWGPPEAERMADCIGGWSQTGGIPW